GGAAAGDPLFGGVVELAAPGPDDPADGRVDHRRQHAATADPDDRRHQAVVHRRAADARARRQPAPRVRQGVGRRARDTGSGRGAHTMSYQGYVIAAYAVFFVILAWDFLATRLQIRRELLAVRRRAARQAA